MVKFKNCRRKTSSSQGTGAFIVRTVERTCHIATAGKYNSSWYHKNFMRQEGICHQRNQRLFRKRTRSFFVQEQEGKKIFLYSEIKSKKKDPMFLKYRNRQQRLAIRSSMFMFNRQFASITSFLFLLRPTKRWKILQHIIAWQ